MLVIRNKIRQKNTQKLKSIQVKHKGDTYDASFGESFLGDIYKYRVLSEAIAEEDNEKLKQRLQDRYRKITDIWGKELNSEWILRHYLAVKMIMSASLMLSSMEYSKG